MFNSAPKFICDLSNIKAHYDLTNQHMSRKSRCHVISSWGWDVKEITSSPTLHMLAINFSQQFETHFILSQNLGGIMAQYTRGFGYSAWWWSTLVLFSFWVRIPYCLLFFLLIFFQCNGIQWFFYGAMLMNVVWVLWYGALLWF